jgi:nucleotide-binding universal stress UspA family protein
MKSKLLLSVDGSECSGRAAQYVVDVAKRSHDIEVHVTNVQPRGDDWRIRRLLKSVDLEAMEREWAENALASARQILAKGGVKCVEHFKQGNVAREIVDLAVELECDQIVMGTRGMSALGDLVLGSIANKVLHLSKVPVTLVK